MILIQNVYYEDGMLHIIFGKDQPIYSLNSAQIGDESKVVGMTVQGEEENQEKIYIIHTSYKESYDITLNIDWIATEPINMIIDLE